MDLPFISGRRALDDASELINRYGYTNRDGHGCAVSYADRNLNSYTFGYPGTGGAAPEPLDSDASPDW